MVPDRERHYAFFGSLAGVRDPDWDPIFEPRGYPPDCSAPANGYTAPLELLPWVTGEHSASFFTLTEAKNFVATNIQFKMLDADRMEGSNNSTLNKSIDLLEVLWSWDSLINDMEYCKKFLAPIDRKDENVRVVFNFDS